jgi:hypothetical protein
MAVVACGADGAQQQGVPALTGTGGAALPGGGGAMNLPPGSGGASVVVGGGGAPNTNAGAPPVGGGGPLPGAGGAMVPPGGGAPSGGAPSGGGVPNGGAPSGGTGGDVVTPDPPNTVILKTDDFQLMPGQEIYKCQNFDNPFGGKDTPVNRIVTDMAKGSHHLHVYNLTEGTNRKLEDCTIADFHALTHAAGKPHQETDYPAGMATKIKGTTGLRIQLHYLNPSVDTLTVGATLRLSPVADPATVTKWVAELYFNRVQLSVGPGMGQTVTTTCAIPTTYGPIGLVYGGTHMHMRGVREQAKSSTGAQLADVNTWDEPPGIAYDPFVMLNPSDTITWTCTYDNNTGKTFTFGESASDNEMCIYLARYYSSDQNDTQIMCSAVSTNGGTARPTN